MKVYEAVTSQQSGRAPVLGISYFDETIVLMLDSHGVQRVEVCPLGGTVLGVVTVFV